MKRKKITLIGTDSTHCNAFAKLLKEDNSPWEISYAIRDNRSQLPISVSRREQIEKQMVRELGIEILDELNSELVSKTDAFIIAAVDASVHLSQFQSLTAFGKPVFIDKPLAYSLSEAKEIQRIAKISNTAFFSSSGLRFSESVVRCSKEIDGEASWKARLMGPITFEKGIPGMYWYGIHLIEALLTIFPDDFKVERIEIDKKANELLIKLISEHCECMIHGDLSGSSSFSGQIYNQEKSLYFDTDQDSKVLYQYLLERILCFFETCELPFSFQETEAVLSLTERINFALEEVAK